MSNLTEQKSDLINEDLFATSTANDPELLYIRSYDQDDEWFSVFHSHPFVEIFYVLDGKGEFVTEEKTIIVEKNDIIIINSDLQHTERLIEGENFTYVVLGISNFSINKTNMHFINKTPLSFHDQYVLIFNASKTSGKFRQVINYMLEESQLNLPYSLRILHHYLRIFLYYIFQYIAPDTLIAKNPQKNKHLYYIKSYMENNFTEDLSL